jgi:Spy/CpxP family protein refolding chaperone
MKKTLLIALILMLSAGMAIAQQQGGPGGGKGNRGDSQAGNRGNPVEHLTENLGLDEAQAAEIALIFEETQLLREDERERCRAVSEEIRVTTHARVMEQLTPDQQALFEEQLQQREQLRQAVEEVRADRGFGGGRGTGDCNG